MRLWSDNLKLGKGSAFVKRDLRLLPVTEAEFEADFWFDAKSSTKRREVWMGMVLERETGAVLAMNNVDWPPPTVNDLANFLGNAMDRPLTGRDRQRPRIIHLRDRPQWQELQPHLEQLGIQVVLADELPWFDQAVVEWLQKGPTRASGNVLDEEKILEALKCPFPPRKPTAIDAALALMHWTDELLKAGYPSARKGTPAAFDPMSTVAIHLTDEELQLILTETDIAKTKKLRPQLEAMVGTQQNIELSVHEWGMLMFSLCGAEKGARARKRLMTLAGRIARSLAGAVGFDGPPLEK
jgi:hypothetical protein